MGWIRDLLAKGAGGGAHRAGGNPKPTKVPKAGGRASRITNLGKGKAFGGWDPSGRRR